MRFALMALLVAVIQQAPQSQTGTIEGTVTRTGSTVVPIAGAMVRAAVSSDPRVVTPLILETTTDGAGHFIFSEVPSGLTKLEVSQEGYGFKSSKLDFDQILTVIVRLAPGQRAQVPGLALTPTATIRGRVLDSEGHGVTGLPVEFLRLTNDEQGRKAWAPVKGDTQTNDQGEFQHTLLGPGDYYVRTILDSQSDHPIAVYYPETTEGGAAAPVALSEGSERVADIHIGPTRDARTYKVSGKVIHPLLKAATSSMELILVERDSTAPAEPPDSNLSALSLANESGQFEFRGVRPGIYDLLAGGEIDGRKFLSKIPIQIRDEDIEDVALVLRPGTDIRGRLVIDGNPQDLQLWRGDVGARVPARNPDRSHAGDIRVVLSRKDRFRFGTTSSNPVIDDSGVSFTFGDVPEGDYLISAGFMTDGRTPNPDLYIADIRASGRSVFDTGFQVGVDPVDSMEIVVGTSGGSVEGILQGKSELPAALILAPDSFRRNNASLYRMKVVPRNSKFRLSGLAPGNYKIFSVPYLNETVPYRDPEFLARHESRALSITVQKGTTTGGLQVPFLSLEK